MNKLRYASWILVATLMFGGVVLLAQHVNDGGANPRKGRGTVSTSAVRRALPAPAPSLPPLTPDYTVTFQAILDAARPKGEGRITVHDCRSGRYGNEHFCAWSTTKYACEAGFIQEQPGNGTVPVQTGRIPGYTRKTCRTGPILAKLFAEAKQ